MTILFIILKGLCIATGSYGLYAWVKSKSKKMSVPKTNENAPEIKKAPAAIPTPEGHPTKPPAITDDNSNGSAAI